MHKLDDRHLVTPLLIRRFAEEAVYEGGGHDDRFHAFLQRSDASYVEHTLSTPCDPMQRVFAFDLLQGLNKDLYHDGAWVILFTNPKPVEILASTTLYDRFCLIWIDQDGDPGFTMDWVEGEIEDELDFADAMMSGLDSWIDRAETAWQNWHLLMREVLDPKANQLVKRAQGQVSATQH